MKTIFPLISLMCLHLCVSAAELEFVQIVIILLAMTFMIVVIICLLNHYRQPALAFLNRLNHTQRDQATQMVGDSTTTMRWAGIIWSLFQWSGHPIGFFCSMFTVQSSVSIRIFISYLNNLNYLLYILLQYLNFIFSQPLQSVCPLRGTAPSD